MFKNIIWEIKRKGKYKKKIVLFFLILIFLCIILLYFSSKFNFINYSENIPYLPKQEINVNDNFQGKLYFNDEINTSKFKNLILESIKNSQKTIDISIYSINMNEVVDALLVAPKRGIVVNIILDKSKKKQHDIVFNKSLDFNILEMGLGFGREETYMHHKFALFDKDTENSKLLFGSFNYTYLQEKYDPSFILETSNKDIINSFKEEYNLMLLGVGGYQKIREDVYKPFAKKINYNNGFVEIWFSPGFKKNSIKQRMLDLISEAKENIDIMIWRLTDDDIIRALYKKAQAGIKIRIISDDYYIWSNNSALKKLAEDLKDNSINNNMEIISDLYRTLNFHNIRYFEKYFNPYLHHHTLIIDNDIVLSGTNNWSYNGFFRNDESILISDVDFWVNGFRLSFNYHYQELKNNNLNLEIKKNKITILDNNEYFIGAKLLIYNEFSEKERIPEKCYETLIDKENFSFDLNLECNQEHSLIFILDENQKVLASTYLNF
jgi:phosphatidylserine/phosphatidylglycerophosphate/cardiolipin synthase-like enzyme